MASTQTSPGIVSRDSAVKLPPGQRAVGGFPRFGTHGARRPPRVPQEPAIEIAGAVANPFSLPLADLATLPRCEVAADFHCVSGWSATGLLWEGVAFETFYRMVIEPSARPTGTITHVVFGGLDGYRAYATIEDALADDVLIAEHLNGRPLDADHGAPARLVSPSQYGFVSTKHLCRVELHTSEPAIDYGDSPLLTRALLRQPFYKRHPRSRVWEEERHAYLPAAVLRPVYRLIIRPGIYLSSRGRRRS